LPDILNGGRRTKGEDRVKVIVHLKQLTNHYDYSQFTFIVDLVSLSTLTRPSHFFIIIRGILYKSTQNPDTKNHNEKDIL